LSRKLISDGYGLRESSLLRRLLMGRTRFCKDCLYYMKEKSGLGFCRKWNVHTLPYMSCDSFVRRKWH